MKIHSLKKILISAIIITLIAGGFYFLWPRTNTYPVNELASYADLDMQSLICPGTLVLFDIDETIITMPDRLDFTLPFRLQLLYRFPQFIYTSEWEWVYSQLWQQAEFTLVEPVVVQLINELKSRGCIVLGLTSMESGAYGAIAHMPEWRFNTLADFGIEFSQQFGNYTFTNLASYRSNYPVLYKGILCANQQPKGDVLRAFLDQNGLKPDKIVFFEDSMTNLQSVGAMCDALDIPVEMYHYTGAEKYQKQSNPDRVLEQIKKIFIRSKRPKESKIGMTL
jgi:uncharacterized protein DUF2608